MTSHRALANATVDGSDFVAARRMCRRVDRVAFHLAHFLPREKGDGVCAIVAACRMFADVIGADAAKVGGCGTDPSGILEMLHARIEAMCAGELELPKAEFRDEAQHVLAAMSATVSKFEISKSEIASFVDGVAADRATARYATWTALQRSIDRVGGAVATMIAAVIGLRHSDCRPQLLDLARGSMVTTFLRDVHDDLAEKRVRLPLEDLAKCRCSERELLAGEVNERSRELVRLEVNRARDLLDRASDVLKWVAGDGSRFAAAMWIELHRATLDELERRGFDAQSAEPRAPFARILRGAIPAWRIARKDS